MIVVEYFTTRADGVVLNRTYSDEGFYIERDGIRYAEAVDPTEFGRAYAETDEPIENNDEATEQDYLAALAELGVNTDEESGT